MASSWFSLYSTIKMMHGPINIRFTVSCFECSRCRYKNVSLASCYTRATGWWGMGYANVTDSLIVCTNMTFSRILYCNIVEILVFDQYSVFVFVLLRYNYAINETISATVDIRVFPYWLWGESCLILKYAYLYRASRNDCRGFNNCHLCKLFLFGYFPGVWVLIADVSELTIGFIFIGRWMKYTSFTCLWRWKYTSFTCLWRWNR